MSYINEIESLRQQQINSMQSLQQAEAKRLQEQTENQIKQLQGQQPQLDERFTNQAQQAYIQKMQAEKQLPQQMAAQGYNGGLSESSRISLDAKYGNNYNALQRDYNSDVNNLNKSVDNARFMGGDAVSASSNRYAGLINDTNMSYNQMLQQAKAEERAQQLQWQMQQAEMAQRAQMQQAQMQMQQQMQQSDLANRAQQAANESQLKKQMQQYEWSQKSALQSQQAAAKNSSYSGGGRTVSKPSKPAKVPDLTGKNAQSIYNTMQGWIKADPSMYMNMYDQSAYDKVQSRLQENIHTGLISQSQANAIAKKLGY